MEGLVQVQEDGYLKLTFSDNHDNENDDGDSNSMMLLRFTKDILRMLNPPAKQTTTTATSTLPPVAAQVVPDDSNFESPNNDDDDKKDTATRYNSDQGHAQTTIATSVNPTSLEDRGSGSNNDKEKKDADSRLLQQEYNRLLRILNLFNFMCVALVGIQRMKQRAYEKKQPPPQQERADEQDKKRSGYSRDERLLRLLKHQQSRRHQQHHWQQQQQRQLHQEDDDNDEEEDIGIDHEDIDGGGATFPHQQQQHDPLERWVMTLNGVRHDELDPAQRHHGINHCDTRFTRHTIIIITTTVIYYSIVAVVMM
jgi:hypothetical protein